MMLCVTQSCKKQSQRHVIPQEAVFAVFLNRAQLFIVLEALTLNA